MTFKYLKSARVHWWLTVVFLSFCPPPLPVCIRLLLLLYLLYIGTFTLCCAYRPLKDAPENYTKSDMDKTIRVQKALNVCFIGLNMYVSCFHVTTLTFTCQWNFKVKPIFFYTEASKSLHYRSSMTVLYFYPSRGGVMGTLTGTFALRNNYKYSFKT